jgi:hypothetical protein
MPQMVMVLRDAETNQFRRVYHQENCHHLQTAITLPTMVLLHYAESRGISACLHCHRAHNREWTCPTCGKYLTVAADFEHVNRVLMQCPDKHVTLRQRPRKEAP